MPHGSRTPPTPPSQSPPPTSRVPAVAHIRPVSIPDIVRDMAGKDPKRKLADFDRRYMPDGVPLLEASRTGKTGENRSNLKRKAKGIARSLAEVFAYLTFEYHSCRFETLDLPTIPDDRSQFDVHGALEDDKVKQLEST